MQLKVFRATYPSYVDSTAVTGTGASANGGTDISAARIDKIFTSPLATVNAVLAAVGAYDAIGQEETSGSFSGLVENPLARAIDLTRKEGPVLLEAEFDLDRRQIVTRSAPLTMSYTRLG